MGAPKPDGVKILIASLLCKIHPCSQFLWLQGEELKILMKFQPPKAKIFRLASISIKVNLSFCGSQCNLEYAVWEVFSKQASGNTTASSMLNFSQFHYETHS